MPLLYRFIISNQMGEIMSDGVKIPPFVSIEIKDILKLKNKLEKLIVL